MRGRNLNGYTYTLGRHAWFSVHPVPRLNSHSSARLYLHQFIMQTLLCSAALIVMIASSTASEFFGVGPFPYHHGNGFYQQQQQASYQPSFPPHFRPLSYPQEYQTSFKPINFPIYQHNEPAAQFSNDLTVRSQLPNPYIPDFPNFYPQFPQPQFEETYQDLNEYNKIPALRHPIQLIPSRFPPRVENFVERLQNRFSIYNPTGVPVLQNGATLIFIPIDPNTNDNSTGTTTESNSTTTVIPSIDVSPTESSSSSTSTDSSADMVTEAVTTSPDTEEVESVTPERIENSVDADSTEVSSTEYTTETDSL